MLLFEIIMSSNDFLGTDRDLEKEINYKNSLSGIVTKSCILISLIPIFVCTTSFFNGRGEEFTGSVVSEEAPQPDDMISAAAEDIQKTSETYEAALEKIKRMRSGDWNIILVNKQHPIPED